MFTLSKDVLKEMLQAQEALNCKFVPDWRNSVKKEWIFTAMFTELAEFLESSPTRWKWWKPFLEDDNQNQYIEVIDVLHFGLSYMLKDKTEEEILDEYLTSYSLLASSSDIFKDLNDFRDRNSLMNFFGLLDSMITYAGLDESKITKIYFDKLALNHKRVDGGYQAGEYEKINKDGDEDNRLIKI